MKIITKIAVFAGIVLFASSCQKEELPSPEGWSSSPASTSNQRVYDSSGTTGGTGLPTVIKDENGETKGADEVVGGGDDDRDGGGSGKKPKGN